MNKLIEKLKTRWEIDTLWQLVLILFIFAITGISTLYVRDIVFGLLGFTSQTSYWIKAASWLGIVLPAYQVLFLFYGFILGQFEFVWRFEKKSLGRITGLFKKNAEG